MLLRQPLVLGCGSSFTVAEEEKAEDEAEETPAEEAAAEVAAVEEEGGGVGEESLTFLLFLNESNGILTIEPSCFMKSLI
jgi:hypothetical protein